MVRLGGREVAGVQTLVMEAKPDETRVPAGTLVLRRFSGDLRKGCGQANISDLTTGQNLKGQPLREGVLI